MSLAQQADILNPAVILELFSLSVLLSAMCLFLKGIFTAVNNRNLLCIHGRHLNNIVSHEHWLYENMK